MRRFVLFLPFVVILLSTGSVDAIIIRQELIPELDEVNVPVWPGKNTLITTPNTIVHWSVGNGEPYKATKQSDTELRIEVRDGAVPSNANLTLRGRRHVSLRFYEVKDELESASRVDFYEPGTMPEVFKQPFSASVRWFGQWSADIHDIEMPTTVSWSRGDHRLVMDVGFALHANEVMTLPITVRGAGAPFPVKRLELFDGSDRPVKATIIHGSEPDEEDVVIRRGQKMGVVFYIEEPHRLAKGWTLVATPTSGIPAARISRYPTPKEKGPLEDRVAVAVHAFGGVDNIDDGVGNNRTLWSGFRGFGGAVTFGIWKYLSVEASLDYAWTSDAMFNDAIWGQQQGDLRVTETSGRVLAGGLVHTAGRRWIPYGRLALGVRLSNRTMSMGSQDDTEFRAGLLSRIGGGLKVLLGKRLIASLSVAYTGSLQREDSTLEAGLSLAASWSLDR